MSGEIYHSSAVAALNTVELHAVERIYLNSIFHRCPACHSVGVSSYRKFNILARLDVGVINIYPCEIACISACLSDYGSAVGGNAVVNIEIRCTLGTFPGERPHTSVRRKRHIKVCGGIEHRIGYLFLCGACGGVFGSRRVLFGEHILTCKQRAVTVHNIIISNRNI